MQAGRPHPMAALLRSTSCSISRRMYADRSSMAASRDSWVACTAWQRGGAGRRALAVGGWARRRRYGAALLAQEQQSGAWRLACPPSSSQGAALVVALRRPSGSPRGALWEASSSKRQQIQRQNRSRYAHQAHIKLFNGLQGRLLRHTKQLPARRGGRQGAQQW